MERLEKIQGLLASQPQDTFLNYALAQEWQSRENYDQAILQYQKLKDLAPEYVGLYYHLADCLIKKGRESEAMSIYDEGMTVARNQGDQHALSELQNARTNLEMGLI